MCCLSLPPSYPVPGIRTFLPWKDFGGLPLQSKIKRMIAREASRRNHRWRQVEISQRNFDYLCVQLGYEPGGPKVLDLATAVGIVHIRAAALNNLEINLVSA